VFDEVFDQAVVYHGFTDYMRDYQLLVYATADPRAGIRPQHVRLLFKHCVRAAVTSTLTPEIWSRSMDELLVEGPGDEPVEGYVWGVRWQMLYPGRRRPSDAQPRRHVRPQRQRTVGRSRGGLTTKLHLAADRRCRPISRHTTPEQRADCTGVEQVMAGIRVRRRRGVPGPGPGMSWRTGRTRPRRSGRTYADGVSP
jgi:hypothetical protein